jgi:very-short-patch-repair endonuclease
MRTTSLFTAEASVKHNNIYDYSKVAYTGPHQKVLIGCKSHGFFWQEASSHLKGVGCSKCHGNNRIDTAEFICRARKVHGLRYGYEKTDYKGNKERILISCSKHGDFSVRANDHLSGYGCLECGKERSAAKHTYTQEEFVQRAQSIHGNRYSYAKAVYVNCEEPVCIVCAKHGEFWQEPVHHINQKSGCPSCSLSKGEELIHRSLTRLGVTFSHNAKLVGCKYKRSLFFDFVLPDHRICIEFDGVQHFQPVGFFGGAASFQDTLRRDATKQQYCKKLNWRLIRIPYTLSSDEICSTVREAVSCASNNS